MHSQHVDEVRHTLQGSSCYGTACPCCFSNDIVAHSRFALKMPSTVQPENESCVFCCRCLAKCLAHPDEAELLAKEVCSLGNLSPNSTTYNLLAETRIRFEQLVGL